MEDTKHMFKCNVNPKQNSKSQLLQEWKAFEHTVFATEIKNKEFPAELYTLHSFGKGFCQDQSLN
jgi:hypothetical protein